MGDSEERGFSTEWLERHRLRLAPVPRSSIVAIGGALEEIDGALAWIREPAIAYALGIDRYTLLLHGAAGSGKSYLVRYLAGSLGPAIPAWEIPGDQLTPERIRGLASHLATAYERSLLVLDDVGSWVDRRLPGFEPAEGGGIREAVLAMLDGVTPLAGPLVVATTTRAPYWLDPSLLRRFGTVVGLGLPNEDERIACLRLFLEGRAEGAPDLELLARLTAGATPASLRAVVDDAARLALRDRRRTIGEADLLAAVRRDGAVELDETVDPARRWRLACHEAGHTACAVRLGGPAAVYSVRIGGGRGLVRRDDHREDRQPVTEPELRRALVIAMGGLAAERTLTGAGSLGSRDDIATANDLLLASHAAGLVPGAAPLVGARHGIRGLDAAARAVLGAALAAAQEEATRIVTEERDALRRFARRLEAAGELAGADLAAALTEAGFRGPDDGGDGGDEGSVDGRTGEVEPAPGRDGDSETLDRVAPG